MLVANSFDLWKKDSFFSAAEEVQESADILESAYRTWVREKREGQTPEDLDELCRELQTALGTAKWQLEEFDKAVRLSYQNRPIDNSRTRHRQFVAAIENQISRVEAALREYLDENGNQPLRWVNLDKEECDDLAVFLSGTSQALQDGCANFGQSKKSYLQENRCKKKNEDLNFSTDISDERKTLQDVVKSNKDAVIQPEAKEVLRTGADVNSEAGRTTGSKRTSSPPSSGDWKIVIADEKEQSNDTSKEKGSKPAMWKLLKTRVGVPQNIHLRGGINRLFGRVNGFQRQPHSPRKLQFIFSIQVKLALLLTVFLIVPFALYST